jgi:hypothetical protein
MAGFFVMVVKQGLVTASSEGDATVFEEQIVLEEIDERLLAAVVEQIALLDFVAPVDVVLAASLNNSVRARASDIVGARYVGERPDERAVAARALRTADGHYLIIVHAGLFSGNPVHAQLRDSKSVSVPRIMQHEGWHVLLMQSDEDPTSQTRRIDPHGVDLPLALAAQFLDEFRVERAMFEDGWERAGDAVGPLSLLEMVKRLRRAEQTPASDSLEAFLETRLGRAHGAAQFVAHEAARVVHLGAEAPARVRDMKKWELFGGAYWDAMYELLLEMPSAKVRVVAEELEPWLIACSRIAAEWLVHVGIPPELLSGRQA